ncbi:hypothetical protein ACLQ8T_15075 [Glutamicibacter sp. FR1]|uniref:hypothetical protein n=1 Tax=Glutamicibacter sp. FR1 TaxID=3393744 RepID=UPI0039AF58DF
MDKSFQRSAATRDRVARYFSSARADVMTTDASETRWVTNEHPELCAVHPDKPFNFSQKAYPATAG